MELMEAWLAVEHPVETSWPLVENTLRSARIPQPGLLSPGQEAGVVGLYERGNPFS